MKKIAAMALAVLFSGAGTLRAVELVATTQSATTQAATTQSATEAKALEEAEFRNAKGSLKQTFDMFEQAIGGLSVPERIKSEELFKKMEGELVADPATYTTRDGKEAFGEKLIAEYRKILVEENAKQLDAIVLRAKTLAEKSYNASSVRGIAMGCIIYAHDNEGKLPENFGQLISAGFCAPKQFVKKGSATKLPDLEKSTIGQLAAWVNEHAEYIYLGAGKDAEKLDANFVLLYDKEGTVFGCADDHVPVLKDEEAAKVLAELNAGKNPPPSLKGK